MLAAALGIIVRRVRVIIRVPPSSDCQPLLASLIRYAILASPRQDRAWISAVTRKYLLSHEVVHGGACSRIQTTDKLFTLRVAFSAARTSAPCLAHASVTLRYTDKGRWVALTMGQAGCASVPSIGHRSHLSIRSWTLR